MTRVRRLLVMGSFPLALVALAGTPSLASASVPPSVPEATVQAPSWSARLRALAGDPAALAAECARLRTELDRANADISALKRSSGVGDDYRLRKRMADAEALARRLTEAEAELRRLRGPLPAASPAPAPARPPVADPHDTPMVLEAKADILADQARRLSGQAEAWARAAEQARTRQVLRRKAGRLDSDPFASLDASKRRMLVPGATTFSTSPSGGSRGSTPAPTTDPGGRSSTELAPASSPGIATAPPPPGAADTSGGAAPAAPDKSGDPGPAAPLPTSGPLALPPAAPGPSSRTQLDPVALAELRRLDAATRNLPEHERLARTAAVLRARAQALEAEARAMRARAKTPGR